MSQWWYKHADNVMHIDIVVIVANEIGGGVIGSSGDTGITKVALFSCIALY